MTLPFIVCAYITAISAIISLGFSIVAALNMDNVAKTMALYACARSLALVLVSAVPFLTAVGALPFLTVSTPWLLAVACSMTIVQACDAAIGVKIKDRMKTLDSAGIALVNLAATIWLLR